MTANRPAAPSLTVANISLQFTEIAQLPDRVCAAAEAGFTAVEFWRWEDVDLLALRGACEKAEVEVSAFVTDWTVAAADPTQHDRLLAAVVGAADAARVLGAESIVVPLGLEVPESERDARLATIAAGLRLVAPRAEERGITILIEAVNSTVDHPGSALTTTADALDLLELVGNPNVRLLFDVYHSVTQGEDAPAEIRRAGDRIAYVQVADAPGRREPGTGSIAWSEIAAALRDIDYPGPIGFEFTPSGGSVDGLRAADEVWGAACADAGWTR